MMMHRLLALSAVSVLTVGAIGLAVSNQAIADPSSRVAQNSSQPSEPSSEAEGRRPHRRIDFAAAATQLGTTEAELREALGLPAQASMDGGGRREGRSRPDLQAAATTLGVSEDQLRQALGITTDPQTGEPSRPRNRPNLENAAAQLNVTEEALRSALGLPDQPGERPRLDISGAATRLGVTEEQVIQALGLPGDCLRNAQ